MIDGRKVVVAYNSWVTRNSHEPTILNTIFASGDSVELDVATNEEFDGNERFVGLAGRLFYD